MEKSVPLPTHKVLEASLQQCGPTIAVLAQATSGSRPALRVPEGIVTTIKNFPKLVAWIGKNRVAYDKMLAAASAPPTGAATGSRTKGATG